MQNFFLLLSAALLLLSSCSIHEEMDLSKEGKGQYQVSMDMGTMLEIMKSMGGSEKIPDSIAKQKKDTTFSLAKMIDSVDGVFTPEEKAYFYNGSMNIKMDMESNKMDVVMKFPVKNVMDLKNLFRVWVQVDSLNKIKKRKQQEQEGNNEMPNAMDSGLDGISDNLGIKPSPYTITDTSIERLEQQKEDIMKDMGEQAQGAAMFMNQVNMMTSIKLPRPAKHVEGKNVKLSDDKFTLFFSASMQDMMDDSKAGAFKVLF